MAVLSREQIGILKECVTVCKKIGYYTCGGCQHENIVKIGLDNIIDTIEHLQQELDRRELAHEKARRQVEVERDRLIMALAKSELCFKTDILEIDGDCNYPCYDCISQYLREVEAE